jgi:hypothetical protein
VLEIEDGNVHLACKDSCDPALFDPSAPTPVCLVGWLAEDLIAEVPVTVTYVDDSTPSTPAGPAEFGFYLEIQLTEK